MNEPTETPETDEAWAHWPYAGSGISVHVGRKLERERNRYKRTLKSIAGQPLWIEMDDHSGEHADWQEYAETMIELARLSLDP